MPRKTLEDGNMEPKLIETAKTGGNQMLESVLSALQGTVRYKMSSRMATEPER
jgi:hypothetical protein